MFELDRDGIPKDASAYRSKEFWEWRYAQGDHHDWLCSSTDSLSSCLSFLTPESTVLVLGCGTSSFSQDLYETYKCKVVNVDYASSAIEFMRKTYPHLISDVMDIRSLEFPDSQFDAVIDKATLDALWSDGGSPWDPSEVVISDVHRVISEVHRVLKPEGRFVSVSLGQPHFRLSYYQKMAPWSQVKPAVGLDTFSHLYQLTK